MKRSLIVGALALSAISQLLGSGAFAADLPPAPPPIARAPVAYMPPAPLYNWSGFYIGVNAGYGWNNATGSSFCFAPGGLPAGPGCDVGATNPVKPAGALAGGQMGWNGQSGWFVYGLETDLQWAGIKQTTSVVDICCTPALAGPNGVYTANAQLDWFGTARVRVGAAADRVLFYATGGVIYGGAQVTNSLVFPATSYPSTSSVVRVGWTAGGGIEGAITQNLTAKVEGLYYDMGSQSSQFNNPVTGFSIGGTEKFAGVMARAGLNWKFGY